ncbi:hypothetical protein ACWNT8_15820 (plasmid) [Pigmentibacter ruber]
MKLMNKNLFYIYLGAFVEAFDFCIYLVFAKQLSNFLIGKENIIISVFVFSISYIARPLGAYYFGLKAKEDKNNINLFLRNSPIWIALPTFIIAFCPNNYFGLYLLLICRFLQGFIFGGESGLSFVYAYLSTSRFKTATISAFLTSGAIAMSMCFILIPKIPSIFSIEAWRVAFILSGILSILFLYFRKLIPKNNFIQLKEKSSVNILKSISYILIYAFMFNVVIAYLTSGQIFFSIPLAMFFLSVFSILFGLLIDKFNFHKIYTIMNILSVLILVISISIKLDLLAFISSYIACCTLGGLSISYSIKYLSKSKNVFPYFGLTYNLVMGCLGALVPILRGLFI